MNILIILGHPAPGSFNHAIAHAVWDDLKAAGHDIIFHDLYGEGFDPLLTAAEIPKSATINQTIAAHCSELCQANAIIIVHPDWWGQPPAILKGWVDRVFRPGVAYRFEEGDGGEGIPTGLLKASAAVVINTSNTPAAREQEAFGDPLDALWRRCIFDLCGVTRLYRRMFSVVVTSTMEQRLAWIEEAKNLCRSALRQDARHDAREPGANPAPLFFRA